MTHGRIADRLGESRRFRDSSALPRGLGLAIATTSPAFFPHLEQCIRCANSFGVTFKPTRRAGAWSCISASATLAHDPHQEVAEAIIEPLDVTPHAHERMVQRAVEGRPCGSSRASVVDEVTLSRYASSSPVSQNWRHSHHCVRKRARSRHSGGQEAAVLSHEGGHYVLVLSSGHPCGRRRMVRGSNALACRPQTRLGIGPITASACLPPLARAMTSRTAGSSPPG